MSVKSNSFCAATMLIHNKRLHPRRPSEPGEHLDGCILHEIQSRAAASARSSKSPSRSRTPTSQYGSSSVLSQRRQRNQSTSSINSALYSPRTPTPQFQNASTTAYNKRNSIGAFPNIYDQINDLFNDVVDSPSKPSLKSSISKSDAKQKSKSTICLNSSLISTAETGKPEKRANSVTFKCYDSPDEIIANLFPGIDDEEEPKYLRKGHGAAQMAKTGTAPRDWLNDGRTSRSYSTSSDNTQNNNNNKRYRSQTYANDRLYSVERDFENLGCVFS